MIGEFVALDAALSYAGLGLAIYAPAAGSKFPEGGSSGKLGLTSATATTDAERLRLLYADNPDRNVAARLDACTPQLCVLDLDTQAAHPHTPPDPDGIDALREWADKQGVALPETWAARTASGGLHMLYRLPEGEALPKSEDNLLPHVDALGAGHGEVLPPSRIAGDPLRAEPYRWVEGHAPQDLPLAELPRELLDLWREAKAKRGGGVPAGRNSTLASLCGAWRREGCDAGEIERRALEWNNQQPDPLPDSEVRKTAASVSRYPKGKGGSHAPTQGELADFMRSDPDLRGAFGQNMLDGGLYVRGPLPWSQLYEGVRRWTDADAENLFVYMQENAGARSKDHVRGAFTICAAENTFNPLRETLENDLPEWDGYARAEHWLHDLLGAPNTPYVRTSAALWARGAVLRAMQPGSKFDYSLVIVGPQGVGKSVTLRRASPRPEFFCEGITDLSKPQEVAEQTRGRLIVEIAELAGATGKRAENLKQELTRQVTTVRLPYERHAIDLPRSCVFAFTTNDPRFLSDPTGARRFLPVRVAVVEPRLKSIATDEQACRAYWLQLWAEVMTYYRAAIALPSEQFDAAYPTTLSEDMEQEAERVREVYTVEDTDAGAVAEWLDAALARGVTRVCARQVAINALHIEGAALRRSATKHVSDLLDRMAGWRRCEGKQRVDGYGVCTAWDFMG